MQGVYVYMCALSWLPTFSGIKAWYIDNPVVGATKNLPQ